MTKKTLKIWITGGPGRLARATSDILASQGHELTVFSRRPLENERSDTFNHHKPATKHLRLDLGWEPGDWPDRPSGSPDVLIHCASAPREAAAVDLAGTRRLLSWLRSPVGHEEVPPIHMVYISIVGVDRSDYPYYQTKYQVEKLLRNSGSPYSILRATQFHHFIEMMIGNLPGIAQKPDLAQPANISVPTGWRFQPVSVEEVAGRLAGIATGPANGLLPDFGGPQVLDFAAMVRSYLQARSRSGSPTRAVEEKPMPELGDRAALFASGINLCAAGDRGKTTWEDYLKINSQKNDS